MTTAIHCQGFVVRGQVGVDVSKQCTSDVLLFKLRTACGWVGQLGTAINHHQGVTQCLQFAHGNQSGVHAQCSSAGESGTARVRNTVEATPLAMIKPMPSQPMVGNCSSNNSMP